MRSTLPTDALAHLLPFRALKPGLVLAAAILAACAVAFSSSGTLSAQGPPPHVFVGSASIDGQPAPAGTVVAALVGGSEVASVIVDATGTYRNLQIPTAGVLVTFTIDGFPAAETATTQTGGATVLNLTAIRAAPTNTPVPATPTPAATAVPAAPTATPVPVQPTAAPTNTPVPAAPAATAAPAAPTATPVPVQPTEAPTSTPVPPTPESFQSAFRTGPTVRLRPVNDVIDQNKDGIIEVLFRNPALNETVMVVDLTVSVPAGIHIYGEGYAQSTAAGAASNTYRVSPGQSQTVKLFVKSEKVGTYTIDFSSVFWPEGNKDLNNPISLTHPFDVRAPSPDPFSATPTDPSERPAATAVIPATTSEDSGPQGPCSLPDSDSATNFGGDAALLLLPIAGIVGMLAIRRRRD